MGVSFIRRRALRSGSISCNVSCSSEAWARLPVSASFLKSAGLYAAASVVNGALPFLLLPVLTRYMSPTDYALTVMFTTTAAFLLPVAGVNLHGAVNVRYFQDTGQPFSRYISTCCIIVAVSTLTVLAMVLAAHSLLTELTGLPATWLAIATLFAAGQALVQVRLVCWQAAETPLPYVAFQLGTAVLTTLMTVLLVVLLGAGWQGRTSAQFAVMLAFATLGLLLLKRQKLLPRQFDRHDARDALAYGLPLIPHSIGALLIAMSDRVIVASKLGLHEAGVYAAGMQVGLITSLLGEAFNRAYGPWLYGQLAQDDLEVRRGVVRFTYLYFGAALFVGIAIGLTAPIFATFLISPTYGDASGYAFWISLGGAFQGMYYMVGLLIAFARKTHWLALVTIVGGLVNVPLTLLLLETNGAIGAAQSYAIIQGLFFLATWLLSTWVYPMPWLR
ncbi:MAG TPA: lipopolysaccharide biosynthesis protein [Steroidobacter sp.]